MREKIEDKAYGYQKDMAYVGIGMILIDANMWCFYFNKSSEEHDAVVQMFRLCERHIGYRGAKDLSQRQGVGMVHGIIA